MTARGGSLLLRLVWGYLHSRIVFRFACSLSLIRVWGCLHSCISSVSVLVLGDRGVRCVVAWAPALAPASARAPLGDRLYFARDIWSYIFDAGLLSPHITGTSATEVLAESICDGVGGCDGDGVSPSGRERHSPSPVAVRLGLTPLPIPPPHAVRIY